VDDDGCGDDDDDDDNDDNNNNNDNDDNDDNDDDDGLPVTYHEGTQGEYRHSSTLS